jgi:hypothetical protein
VKLNEGLEEIGDEAFEECASLHEIVIPPAIRMIKSATFYECAL